jgi:carboxymethylenebutenolidase
VARVRSLFFLVIEVPSLVVETAYVDLAVDQSPMRVFVAAPKLEGRYPGVIFYSDIFQLTGPMLRATTRLAGYGFVVAAPEIYHRIEPPGTGIPFNDAGRERGLGNAAKTSVAEFDADCRAVLDYLKSHPRVDDARLGAAGFCIGGHLAFRAALQPDVRATVCFYGTGIHNGKLGRDPNSGSLERAREIQGELLMIFGTADPHVPNEGRARIKEALEDAGVKHAFSLYDAEHAFMRDEGPRYDPEATDRAWSEMIDFYRRALAR